MTWESQGPATPQDPRATGAYQPPQGQMPPEWPSVRPDAAPWPDAPWPAPVRLPATARPWGPPPPYGQPGAGWGPPPAAAHDHRQQMWQPPPAFPLAPDAYPVNVSYDRGALINRLWGIPLIGQGIRWILLIPHIIVLMLRRHRGGHPILVFSGSRCCILGRFPGWGYRWIGGLLGYYLRVTAYALLMTSTYPPFSLSGEYYPISVRFDEGVRINRLWGIPLIGQLVRAMLLIPHFIVALGPGDRGVVPDDLRVGAGALPRPPG